MSRINIIVAATKNMVIGKGNDMPWSLPSDLKYFKQITGGHCVIMGRKCWESIPPKFRPLPNRLNIVLTKNEQYEALGATILSDVDQVLQDFKNNGNDDDIFVIGGAQIYKEAFKYADKLYLTQIDAELEGDTFLEGFNLAEWKLITASESKVENGLSFKFEVYEKNK